VSARKQQLATRQINYEEARFDNIYEESGKASKEISEKEEHKQVMLTSDPQNGTKNDQ
jgi:uncharacterized protein YdcH (DUF465 family)